MGMLHDLLRDEQGTTAVEYGLILAAVAGLVITVTFVLATQMNNLFNNVQAGIR